MTGRSDELDGATLLTPVPANEIAILPLPAGEGLKDGDHGAVVDALHRDRGCVTVESSRNAKTGNVTDVSLTCLRLLRKGPATPPESQPAQRTAA